MARALIIGREPLPPATLATMPPNHGSAADCACPGWAGPEIRFHDGKWCRRHHVASESEPSWHWVERIAFVALLFTGAAGWVDARMGSLLVPDHQMRFKRALERALLRMLAQRLQTPTVRGSGDRPDLLRRTPPGRDQFAQGASFSTRRCRCTDSGEDGCHLHTPSSVSPKVELGGSLSSRRLGPCSKS